MSQKQRRREVPNLEEMVHQLENGQKALDILALDVVEGHSRHDIAGKALLYVSEHLEADIAAVRACLDRYANATPEAREANMWATECPWSNGQIEQEADDVAAA